MINESTFRLPVGLPKKNATHCPNFHSRFYQIDCSGIDTLLALNLNGLHGTPTPSPPAVSGIARFLQHLLLFRGTTILICPIWEGSNFWRLLCPADHTHSAPFIRGYHPLTAWGLHPDIGLGPIGHPSFLANPITRHQWEWAAFLIDTTNNFPGPFQTSVLSGSTSISANGATTARVSSPLRHPPRPRRPAKSKSYVTP